MKPRVAFVAHDGRAELGGVGTWMGNLIPWLIAHGVDVRVYGFTRGGDMPLFRGLAAQGVRLRLMRHNWPLKMRINWLERMWARDGITVVLPNYFISAFAALRKMGPNRPASICVLHSDDPLYRRLIYEVAQRNPDFPCDAMVAVSELLVQLSAPVARIGVPVKRIPYGVHLPAACAQAPKDDSFHLVYTGRLIQEQKRILDTVKVSCEAVKTMPGVSVDFIGDGNEAEACRLMVRDAGVSDRVRFLGRKPAAEVQALLPKYHALLLLSDYEGLPLSLLEAAAVGVVPICTRIASGVSEVVEHRQSGFFVENRSSEVLTAITSLKADPALWRRCSEEIRRRGQSYGVGACGMEWQRIIAETNVLSPPPAGIPVLPSSHWLSYGEFTWDYGFAGTFLQRVKAALKRKFSKLA